VIPHKLLPRDLLTQNLRRVHLNSGPLARRLVAHAREGVIRFFSLESGALVGTTAMNEGIEALAFTEDGDGLAVVTGGAVVTGRVS